MSNGERNSRLCNAHVSSRSVPEGVTSDAFALWGQKLDVCPSKLESSKERFSSDAQPRCNGLAKFVELPTRPIKVRRTVPRYQRTTMAKVADNRSSKKVLGRGDTFWVGSSDLNSGTRQTCHELNSRGRNFGFLSFLENLCIELIGHGDGAGFSMKNPAGEAEKIVLKRYTKTSKVSEFERLFSTCSLRVRRYLAWKFYFTLQCARIVAGYSLKDIISACEL